MLQTPTQPASLIITCRLAFQPDGRVVRPWLVLQQNLKPHSAFGCIQIRVRSYLGHAFKQWNCLLQAGSLWSAIAIQKQQEGHAIATGCIVVSPKDDDANASDGVSSVAVYRRVVTGVVGVRCLRKFPATAKLRPGNPRYGLILCIYVCEIYLAYIGGGHIITFHAG